MPKIKPQPTVFIFDIDEITRLLAKEAGVDPKTATLDFIPSERYDPYETCRIDSIELTAFKPGEKK